MNTPAKATEETLRQPDVFERTVFMGSELLQLASNFAAATARFEAARVTRNFAGMRSAYLDIAKFTDQAALCEDSVQRTLDAEQQRAKR